MENPTYRMKNNGTPYLFFRMKTDQWFFAILLSTGDVIGVSHIEDIFDQYIDFVLLEGGRSWEQAFGRPIQVATSDRLTCTVRKDHIVAIQDMADT